jgi:hypothetical protein
MKNQGARAIEAPLRISKTLTFMGFLKSGAISFWRG